MKNYNPSITERANRIFNLKNGEGMSEEIEGPVAVIPVVPVSRFSFSSSSTGTTTVFTSDTGKDTYITAVTLGIAKDAAATTTTVSLKVYLDGVQREIAQIAGLAGTAQLETISLSFPFPIKIDRGQIVQVAVTAAGPNTRVTSTVTGYTEEVTRA